MVVTENPEELVVSTQVLAEFYWTMTRGIARPLAEDLAAEAVGHLARYRVIGNDAGLVLSAVAFARAHRLAIWDALIVRAAQVARCDRLLTEDLHDGARYGDVVVVNPFREAGATG